jgi:hypothetical protein
VKKFGGDKKYFYWGFTAFTVIAGCILLYVIIMQWSVFASGVGKVFRILSPFVWGFVIAYLLRPLMRFFERRHSSAGRELLKRATQGVRVRRVTALIFRDPDGLVVLCCSDGLLSSIPASKTS